MPFAPENALEEVLLRAMTDPAARPQFYAMLMQSPLYALGQVRDHADIHAVLADLTTRHFELRQLSVQGRRYHPVFTSPGRIRALTQEPQPYFTVLGRALFEQTRGAAFVINFGSEAGKELLPQEIGRLLGGRADPPEVVIGQAQPWPGKLTGALGILFLNRMQITAAHLAQARIPGEAMPRYLIGLVADGDIGRLVEEIAQVAQTVKTQHLIDIVVLDPAAKGDDLSAHLLAVPPFYARPIKPN